jgi:glutamyl-tRNA(Gln) amidotransferase subunit E
VSIEEGSRVEIKGFQDLNRIDELVDKEVERQKSLVELGDSFSGDPRIRDASEVFEDSDSPIVGSVLESGGAAVAVVLPGLDGELNTEISGARRLVEELVDYAKSRGVNGLIHTDEDLEDYGLEDEFDGLRSHLDLAEGDAVAVVAADEDTAESAAEAVKQRAEMLYAGEVPEETRQGEDDATTSYLRPLPGAARMYPETDIPPVRVPEDRVEEIDGDLPETLDELEERYSKDIGQELASQIVSSRHLSEFERFRDLCDSRTVANVFVNALPALEADGVEIGSLSESHFRTAFEACGDRVGSGELPELLRQMTGSDPEEALDEFFDSRSSEDEIREVVDEVVGENREMVEEQGLRSQGALMGEVMQRVDAPGDEVSRILRERLEQV